MRDRELASEVPTETKFEPFDPRNTLRTAKFNYTWDFGNGYICLFIIEYMFCCFPFRRLGYIFKYYVVVLFFLYLFIRCCVMLFFTVRITVVFCCLDSVECSIPSGTTLETSGIALTCYPWVVLSA